MITTTVYVKFSRQLDDFESISRVAHVEVEGNSVRFCTVTEDDKAGPEYGYSLSSILGWVAE